MNDLFFILTSFYLYKIFLFSLWLWQLKNYHWGRFKAHFETQKIGKFTASFYRIKFPVLTKKTILISLLGLIFVFALNFIFLSLINNFLVYAFFVLLSPIFFSFFILVFQIPTIIFRKKTIQEATRKREKCKKLLVIGITGSYGKSSVKEFLSTILVHHFGSEKVLKTEKNENSEMGISLSILKKLNLLHRVFVVEMGAYNKGGIKLLCDIAKPGIGVLTGINEQHVSTFGSQENIVKAKFELVQEIPGDGLVVLNYSDENIKNKINKETVDGVAEFYDKKTEEKKEIIFCSSREKKDFWAEKIKVERHQVSFKVFSSDGDSAFFNLKLIGESNIENVLLASAVAKKLGMTLSEISEACLKIKPEENQIKFKKGIDGLNIIDSSYSSNTRGIMDHLNYLETWSGKKVIVMPCLIELGALSGKIHEKIGEKIAEVCDLAVITTQDYFKEIQIGAKGKALYINDPDEIFEKIKNFNGKDDVVLLESRVPKKLIDKIIQ